MGGVGRKVVIYVKNLSIAEDSQSLKGLLNSPLGM